MNTFQFNHPTDKMDGAWHQHYKNFYSRILAGLRDTTDCVAELGTDSGGPLLAYREWFSKAKMVVGMDVNPPPQCLWGKDGLHHYQMDAYTRDAIGFLKSHGEYACVIDDGSHFLHHQFFFAEHYPTLLSKDGVAIIEDIQNWDHVAQICGKVPNGFLVYGVDLRWADNRYDSTLLVIERK